MGTVRGCVYIGPLESVGLFFLDKKINAFLVPNHSGNDLKFGALRMILSLYFFQAKAKRVRSGSVDVSPYIGY